MKIEEYIREYNRVDRDKHGVKSIVMVDNKGAYIFIDVAASYIHDS